MRSWVNWWLLIFLFGLFLKASGSFLKATGSLLRARTRDLFLFFLHLPSLVLRSVVNSLHTADRSLLSLVGEDNTILHSFLRLIVCMALVVAAWIVSQAFIPLWEQYGVDSLGQETAADGSKGIFRAIRNNPFKARQPRRHCTIRPQSIVTPALTPPSRRRKLFPGRLRPIPPGRWSFCRFPRRSSNLESC